ncbi:hypothetical protein [Amycolatopsis sp. lyj-112]|uniref:WD40 repeat domain-containing protein n=1 Tax=Amycolatopsis sp. lyj-112 TaxID=2789288 RepID=UPI0039798047
MSDRASGVFLVARMTARGLRKADAPVDVTVLGWQDALPSEIDQAFEAYLDRYGSHRSRVRSLLTPLAFAEGQGLPRGVLWLNIAARLANRDFREEDVDWLLDEAGDYVAEVTDNGHSVYRLYHQSLAEHLRANYHSDIAEAQRRIVDAVLPTIPARSGGAPDWFAAHRYLRAHLSTHAAAAGRLDELVEQPGFLLVAEQLALLKAFAKAVSESVVAVRSAYEQAAHQLVESVPLAERAAYLQLSARRCRADHLADRIDVSMPWRAEWAWWSLTGAHRQLVGHESAIRAVSTGSMDGRAVAVTGGADGTARMWDLMTRRPLGEPLEPGSDAVTALAIREIADYVVLVTGGDDGRLAAWDLSTGKMLGQPLEGHTNSITSVAVGVVAGKTIAVSGSRDGTARVWDLSDPSAGVQQGIPFVKHRSAVNAVALAELDGAMVVLSGGDDKRVHVWDVVTQEQLGEPLIGHTAAVSALASIGRTVVTGSKDQTIGLWDLRTRQQIGEPIVAHQQGVQALAAGELNGVPVAVSCGQTDAKVWNLDTRRLIGQPLVGHIGVIRAVAFGTVDRTPVAITGGTDRTGRIWDLNADQPLAGHTDEIVSVAISRVDGRSLAVTGSEDTTAIVWDLERGVQDGSPLSGHRTPVTAAALGTNDGRPVVVTGGEDAVVHIWDLLTRRQVGPALRDHTGPITALLLGNVDGAAVLVTGSRDGTVRLWNPTTGATLGEPLLGHNADVQHMILSEVDGRPIVVVASWSHITGWDFRTRKKLDLDSSVFHRQRVLAIGYADRRTVAITQANDNSLLRWDLIAGSTIGDPLVAHTGPIEAAVIGDRAGVPVALTSSYDDLTVRIWDLQNGAELGVPLTRDEYINPAMAIGVLTEGAVAVTLGSNEVRLWSLETFQQIGEPLCGADIGVRSLSFGTVSGQKVIVCGCSDGRVRIRDLVSGQQVGPLLNGHWNMVSGCVVTDVDGLVAITADRSVARIWDLTTYRERSRWTHSEGGAESLLALSRCDGRQLVVTTTNAEAHIWELASKVHLAELAGHTGEICAVATAECGDVPMVLTGSRDTTARLWNARTMELACAPLIGHGGDVNAVTFGKLDGQSIAFTGDDDGVVRGWDPRTGDHMDVPIPEMSDWVTALAFGTVQNKPILAISAANGTIRLWNGFSRETVAEIQLHTAPNDLAIHSDGYLCVATAMGVVALRFGDGV